MNNRYPYYGGPNRPPPIRPMQPIQPPPYGVMQYPGQQNYGYFYHQPDGPPPEYTQYAQRFQYNTAETIVTDGTAHQQQQGNVVYLQGGRPAPPDNYYNSGNRQPFIQQYQPPVQHPPPAALPAPVQHPPPAALPAPIQAPPEAPAPAPVPPAVPATAPPAVRPPAPATAPPAAPPVAPPVQRQAPTPPPQDGTNHQQQQQQAPANRQLQEPILFDDIDDFGFSLELQNNLDEVFRLTPDSPEEKKLVDEVRQIEEKYAADGNQKVLTDEEVLKMPTFMLSEDDMVRRRLLQQRVRQKRHIAKLVREKGQE